MALTAEQEAARAAAMARGAEPKPQPRILESNITPELCTALAAFQADLPRITKDRRVDVETKEGKDNYSYDYATLENVNYSVIPKLGALGLAFVSTPTLGMDGRPVLRYYLTHSSGGFIAGEFPIRGETMQAIGSAITYIRRYAVQGVTGVAAPEEDDGGKAADAEADNTPRTAARRARTNTAAANTERANAAARERQGGEVREPAPTRQRRAPQSGGDTKEFGPPTNPDAPATSGQKQKIAIQMGELGFSKPEIRRDITGRLVGRPIQSSNELTMGEAHNLIETIESAQQTPNPIQTLKDVAADVAARQAAPQESPADRQADAESEAWEQELAEAREERGRTE